MLPVIPRLRSLYVSFLTPRSSQSGVRPCRRADIAYSGARGFIRDKG
jgi:hypothetical protein